ncbi:MAG: hypothetical protein DAHOPDDO_03112 [Ignavibacteriaceae bacterium]|nr:hypothetical protein [Ignavibacteriaceae bacterium]
MPMVEKMNTQKFYLMNCIILILSANIFGQAAVNIPLSATDGTTTYELAVGLDLTATNCIDTQLGEYNINWPPVYFAITFDLTPFGCPSGTNSFKDYRGPGNPPAFPFTGTIVHMLWWNVSLPGTPIDITYNIPNGAVMYLTDNINGSFLNIGPFTGQGMATIPGSYTNIFTKAYLKMEYSNINPGATTQSSVSINNGWNLLSVPLAASDMTGTFLFPTAISPFYYYNAGYNQVTTLENGKGYWAKFDSSQNVTITGNHVTGDEISIVQGWNLIGPFAYNVVVSGITTVPPNILSSPFYGYEGGYIIPTTLLPGKGYWIKANQNGVIQLNADRVR